MLRALSDGDRTVSELAAPLDMSLAAASKHIKVLEQAGLLRREVKGRTHICRLAPEPLASAQAWLNFYEQFWTARLDVLDRLLRDGEQLEIGPLRVDVLATPGHTDDSLSYRIGNAVFIGDTLFAPETGTARVDFPGGDAGTLYDSIQKVLSLPDEMRLFMCHDYGPNGRAIAWETSVAEEKANNIHVGGGKTRAEFIKFRTERDAQLDVPKLIIPSLQVNMRAGEIPTDPTGRPMLKVPVNGL